MNEPISVGYAEVIREAPSGKALLVLLDGEEIWIPKWAIHDDSEVWKDGQDGELIVKYRFADVMGWA